MSTTTPENQWIIDSDLDYIPTYAIRICTALNTAQMYGKTVYFKNWPELPRETSACEPKLT